MSSSYAHKVFVYCVLTALLFVNIAFASKLAELGALSQAEVQTLGAVFDLLAAMTLAMAGYEISTAFAEYLIEKNGKHRVYLAVTAFVVLGYSAITFTTWTPAANAEFGAVRLVQFSLMLGLIAGLPYARGGVFEKDIQRVLSVVGK